MGWKGAAIGGWIGSLFGGPLGAVLGAALGHSVERFAAQSDRPRARVRRDAGPSPSYADMSARRRQTVFCASAAAMLAKMAKADGRVTRDEIEAVEAAFARLGFSRAAREYAVSVFRRAKDDSHSIYDYAREFAAVVNSVELCELLYALLWDVACADGTVSRTERQILSRIPSALGIRPEWFRIFVEERLGERPRNAPVRDPLDEAYALLGVAPSASDDDVRRSYRQAAKKWHPDSLRAQGVPEEMLSKATEKMARINDAWSAIRKARGI